LPSRRWSGAAYTCRSSTTIAIGESRYLRDLEISASRGKITDRNGDMLAVSTPMKTIWAIPGDARTMSGEQKKQLAALLGMGTRELDGKIAPDKTFVFVKRQVRRKPVSALPG
jgi:cell division protein FtsI (penicillin-binding protein 3)